MCANKAISHLTYRGAIRSCNYSCSYCPFAKNIANPREQLVDEKALARLLDWVTQHKGQPLTVFLAPYGEVLNLDYYWTFLGHLTALPELQALGCQTNLSFAPEGFRLFEEAGGDLAKLSLWSTYHPEMVTLADFLAQVAWVKTKVRLSVGVVGIPQQLAQIQALQEGLPQGIYLWINAMDGLKRPYSSQEVADFSKIDPLFPLEAQGYPCDLAHCDGGRKSIFVNHTGQAYLCNKQRKPLGNIYHDQPLVLPQETRGRCDCYLSYCHRLDLPALAALGEGRGLRVPQPKAIKIICFDLDGTLMDENGLISESTCQGVAQLAQCARIYLVTMRPAGAALGHCGPIKAHLSGGVFAAGAEIIDFATSYHQVQPLGQAVKVAQKAHQYNYRHQGEIYKTTVVTPKQDDQLYYRLQQDYSCAITQENEVISLVHQSCSKYQGLCQLLATLGQDPAQVMVVGNAASDVEMLQAFHHSVAVPTACPEAKKAAKMVLDVPQLALLVAGGITP